MKKIFSALDLLWTIGLCLGMMQFISAQTVYESIDLTLAPGEYVELRGLRFYC